MKYDELKAMLAKQKVPQRHRHLEGDIQEACVTWFRYAYPTYLIFAIPNGGTRNAREAAQIKREGALAGVADLIIVADNAVLFIEMKTKKNKQQESQKRFQEAVERLGHRYVVCHSLQEFQLAVERWLKERYGYESQE